MVFDITQLKKIRKKLDLTQNQLAKEIGISQSMVTKIESGKLDPTYSYVKKIEKAINSLLKKEEKNAKDVMNKKIISVKGDIPLENIITLFEKHEISQVPVMKGNNVFGLVTESELLDQNFKEKKAKDVMKESPPIISFETPISAITSLLKFYPIVLVKNKEKFVGVITKADILHNFI